MLYRIAKVGCRDRYTRHNRREFSDKSRLILTWKQVFDEAES